MIKKYLVIILLSGLFSNSLKAQSDIKLSVQNFQPLVINPAYAGSYEGLAVSAMHSSQWTGFDGAPKTQFLTANYRFTNDKVGVGLSIYKDEIGPLNEYNVEGNYSYNVILNDEFRLTLGLKVGLNNFDIDYNKLHIENPGEVNGLEGDLSQLSPIVGAGLYLYDENFFFGFSTPTFIKTKYLDNNSTNISKRNIYLYSNAGYAFKFDNDFNLTPILQYRYTSNAPSSLVFMANLEWKDSFFGGLNTDFDSSLGAFVGVRFLQNFKFAYSYESSLNDFSGYNGGGHTFLLTYEFSSYKYHNERRSYNRF